MGNRLEEQVFPHASKTGKLIEGTSSPLGELFDHGTFQAGVSYATQFASTFSVIAADFNGDGKPDLVVDYGSSSANASVLLNSGTGTFGAASTVTVEAVAPI